MRYPIHYKLEGHEPVPVEDVQEWGAWFQTADRVVRKDALDDGSVVSTVFLGLDHQFGSGPPLLFETMIFLPSGEGDEQRRYATWNEAEAGHDEMIAVAILKSYSRAVPDTPENNKKH